MIATASLVWLLMSSEFSAGQHQLITGKVKMKSLSHYGSLLGRKFCGKVPLKKLLCPPNRCKNNFQLEEDTVKTQVSPSFSCH